MGETETAMAKAIQDFEEKVVRGDSLKVADYVRMLEGLQEMVAEPPATMTLRWAERCEQTISNEQ